MKFKDQLKSKISTPQIKINQKNLKKDSQAMNLDTPLLKKNELTMIIIGALVVTIIVFFVFFKSSGPETQASSDLSSTSKSVSSKSVNSKAVSAGTVSRGAANTGSLIELENRIQVLESVLEKFPSKAMDSTPETARKLVSLQQKLQRLETSALVKLDSLTERMGKLERQLSSKKKSKGVTSKVKVTPIVKSKQKISLPVKTKPVKKASMFHTVQKGDTLWHLSQKYKTSVAKLRKLNNLVPGARIYPGTNLIIR
ncbi:MAG: LysM peptidoglycan-binding domain-containing protein [Desulfobacteraceae bacterium]|nr:LysM peptidoglycan-binding domain-containing protein [Desulfobacteraceae bacterium]